MEGSAFIGFGTNLGDLVENCRVARDKLVLTPGIRMLRSSPLYRTEPLTPNGESQPWYLNGVFEITTDLTLHGLFDELQRIECEMGRKPHKKWASRVMDLDLLFYDDVIFSDAVLDVPHREVSNRRFVLKPFCDLSPDHIHPAFQMTVAEILQEAPQGLRVEGLAKDF